MLPAEFGTKLFHVTGRVGAAMQPPAPVQTRCQAALAAAQQSLLGEISARNNRFFDEEMEKLERWADDLKYSLETELKDLDVLIRHYRF